MKTKMRQISIKLPNALVTALDEAATKSHRTRANVIQQAAEYYLNDFEDITSILEILRDPWNPALDWGKIKHRLLHQH